MRGDENKKINGRYESVYMHSAENILKELNQVSPSFCLAKWYNVSIHIPTGMTHSCYHPPAHKIPLEEIVIDASAIHNTKYKKEQRKLMLQGERPNECSFCWEIEDSGSQLSDRAYRSKDVYNNNLIEEALTVDNPNPKYVEINFNQACNFKCTYCSPHLSTEWMYEIQRNGPFKLADRLHHDLTWMTNSNMIPNNSPDNPYLQAFWKWFPTIYFGLHTFRMTGGEPLMDKNTFKIFDYVKANPKNDLHLSITSNCCPPSNQWEKFMGSLEEITDLRAIDHFMLFCSLDSWGSQAEYIRTGMNFDTLYKNITDYLVNGKMHSLTFICTFNVLSYFGWNNYIRNILKLRQEFNTNRQLIWFDIPQLSSPDWMNPKLMPEMLYVLEDSLDFMKQNIETDSNKYKGFKDFEISKVQRLIDWIKNPTKYDRIASMKNFYQFFSQVDKRNNSNILTTFPTLEKFWNECQQLQ